MYKADKHTIASIPELLKLAGGLGEGVADRLAEETGVPAADITGVGTFFHLLANPQTKVRVCQGLSCRMAGSEDVLKAAQDAGLPVEGCSCLAACDRPTPVLIERRTLPDMTPDQITTHKEDWKSLKESHPAGQQPWSGYCGPEHADPETLAFNLRGETDWSWSSLQKAKGMSADQIVSELEASGLQGRGGAGFPAARKWQSVLMQQETTRYVVLNADEGEPGTFKDRELLLRRPDLVLEGLAIAAQAIGAQEVYLYCRGEFEIAITVLEEALERLTSSGHVTEIKFHIHEGQGAYICGEETALIEALEGKRGMPRLKPPFPTEQGLWGKPTLMHNVETIAALPAIIRKGGQWFHDLGTTGPGSKLYCVSGHVNRPGVYELPLGVTLDELAEAAGGYVGNLKFFCPGGAAAGYLPAEHRDKPLDFTSLREYGTALGSAGIVVVNDTYPIKQAVMDQLEFFEAESCGQCAPCRIGTQVQRIGLEQDKYSHAEDVAWEMAQGSICGLGHTASAPLTSAMKWFPEEFPS